MKKSILAVIITSAFTLTACDGGTNSNTKITEPVQVNNVLNLESVKQSDIENIANSLNVNYQMISNHQKTKCNAELTDGLCFEAKFVLTASEAIKTKDWHIIYSQIAPLHNYDSDQFHVEHLNGDLHKISLKPEFSGFEAGESKEITFRAAFWSVSESDLMPNFIVTADTLKPAIIKSTEAKIDPDTGLEYLPYVTDYTDKDHHFKRSKDDATKWLTAETLFERNKAAQLLSQDVSTAIIPTPSKVKIPKIAGELSVASGLDIQFNNVAKADVVAAITRLDLLGIQTSNSGVKTSLNIKADNSKQQGSYKLAISPNGIEIEGVDAAGVFNALQSVASLTKVGQESLPYIHIEDEPLFAFRGVLIDTSRNFRSKEFMLKLIDQMAAYKLNKLHFHLGDDEGWRLEIPGLPELTEIGSKRCFDVSEQNCLMPQLGAGLDETSTVNGYYSVADYTEILQAASARHIQVIPSLDMPGHARAAIKAMEARYNKFIALEDKEKAEQYLLHDINDVTKYSSVQFYGDNTINACKESSYAFVEKVMQEVQKIHNKAGQPLTRYHIGADETAGAWVESQECKDFIATNDKGITEVKQLGSYFVERVSNMISEMGIEPAAWSDGLEHTHKENMPAVVQANAWDHLAWEGHKKVNELANRNWQIVVSSPDVTYFDFPYEADPKEHGYYWASRQTNTEKVFQFMPENLPIHAEFWLDRQDLPYIADDTVQHDENGVEIHKPLTHGRKFLGLQAQLWGENLRSDTLAEHKLFPRLIALAERAWYLPRWAVPYNYNGYKYSQDTSVFNNELREQRDNEWVKFANVLGQKEFTKLELSNIAYRLPTVGAQIVDNKLHANVAFPGVKIEFKTDDGKWQVYRHPVEVSGVVKVRTSSENGTRKGRITSVNE